MSVGSRIKEYMKEKEIAQKTICLMTGISPVRMSLSLGEKRRLTFEEYALIIKALELPMGTFIEPEVKDAD